MLLCTGYDYKFPFLEQELLTPDPKIVHPLAFQCLHVFEPTLCFIGLPWRVLPFLQFELQSKFICSIWTHKSTISGKLTTYELIKQLYRDFEDAYLIRKLKRTHKHYLGPAQWDYNRQLLKYSGLYNHQEEKKIDLI